MRLSIGGYSFHRLLEAGKQDMFQYISDCKAIGATQLDPWNAQFAPIQKADDAIKANPDPEQPLLSDHDKTYLAQVRQAAETAALPFGCIAVDGAHLYEPEPAAREANRRIADRWLEVAVLLGAPQVRIDAGGPEDPNDDIFTIIVTGYRDLVARAQARGLEILIENHWGPSLFPKNVIRILEAVPGLGLLFDTNNWAPGFQIEGWERCARYARSTHFKTFNFDDDGNEPSVDLAYAVRLLVESGYQGCWGIESCPADGDEYTAVRKTAALIQRSLEIAQRL